MIQKIAPKLYFTLLALFASVMAFAQEGTKKLDVDIDVNKGDATSGAGIMNNPIIWVVGAAVFILLLVALMRGRRNG